MLQNGKAPLILKTSVNTVCRLFSQFIVCSAGFARQTITVRCRSKTATRIKRTKAAKPTQNQVVEPSCTRISKAEESTPGAVSINSTVEQTIRSVERSHLAGPIVGFSVVLLTSAIIMKVVSLQQCRPSTKMKMKTAVGSTRAQLLGSAVLQFCHARQFYGLFCFVSDVSDILILTTKEAQ